MTATPSSRQMIIITTPSGHPDKPGYPMDNFVWISWELGALGLWKQFPGTEGAIFLIATAISHGVQDCRTHLNQVATEAKKSQSCHAVSLVIG